MAYDVYNFLDDLFELYPNSWTESTRPKKEKQYLTVLRSLQIDYHKLMARIAKYYEKDFMPAPAWLLAHTQYCYNSEAKESAAKAWRQPLVYNPITKMARSTDAFPAGTTDEQMIRTYEKMSGVTGWQVVEG